MRKPSSRSRGSPAGTRERPQGELDFDQTSGFDPPESDPGPDFDFDQSLPEDLDV